MNTRAILAALAIVLTPLTPALHAQVPQLVNYQGRVAVGTANFNGSGQFKFALVNAAGTATYWSNDGTGVGGAQPTAAVALTVTKGLYSVLLGDTSPPLSMTAIPASVWTNADVRLRVWFNDGTNGFQLLTPDQRLAPSGYLPDGSVPSAALASGAVTSAKIASGAVTSTQLAAGAVQSAHIAAGAVGSTQLSASVPQLGVNQIFTGQNTFNNAANSFSGSGFSLGNGAGLNGDQGGSLELGNSLQVGAGPFIDFHYGTGSAQDYNVRLQNNANGVLSLGGNLNVNGDTTSNRVFVTNGVIQRGGAPVTTTNDLGLYSQLNGQFMRFVTNAAPFNWYTDSGAGTTPRMTLTSAGDLGIGTSAPQARLHVAGNLTLDGSNLSSAGRLHLQAGEKLYLNPFSGDSYVGFGGGPGNLYVAGNVGIGTATPATTLDVNGEITAKVVTITGGSDVAEPYEVAGVGEIQPLPGMVVAIDTEHIGQMRVAARAYDRTVAGILSGANGIAPGITLRQKGTVADGTLPVASIGRVWCWCDAEANGPIQAGDMLTTSDTPGHAMRVADHAAANGAVIGKAMSGLKSGKGLVLVLVSLK